MRAEMVFVKYRNISWPHCTKKTEEGTEINKSINEGLQGLLD